MNWKNILACGIFVLLGFVGTYTFLWYSRLLSPVQTEIINPGGERIQRSKEIIGFLPYWLLSYAQDDYSPYITTLTYYGLTIAEDGSIEKYTNPGEAEPGWHTLDSEKLQTFFSTTKSHNIRRSLLPFSANQEKIEKLLSDPIQNATTMMAEVLPLLKQYEFSDLNIDIESVALTSSEERTNFTLFIKQVKTILDQEKNVTLTIDISPSDLIRQRLIDLAAVQSYVNTIVLMTYDYHYVGSLVSGAVAPNTGAGIEAEFDVETGIQKALKIIPKEKIRLGIPLYGYQWETVQESSHSATIPTSGLVISSRKISELLSRCASCSAQYDEIAQESYLVYKDIDTNTYHQTYFPTKKTIEDKLKLSQKYDLGGVALWALGYEDNQLLEPLKNYK